ncbi:hypothetical protein BST20_07250 [Mycobacterium branderi]|uniref:Uncharacterized protein n=1 Tax=Mycobacterium branderi TaxID=43348 RepID=A0AA91RJ99_9MYCO|nr:hypothetical protein BST20_07250 [Mycobacterium branderi]
MSGVVGDLDETVRVSVKLLGESTFRCRSGSSRSVDEQTRECFGGMVERSIIGEHLIVSLDAVRLSRSDL